MNLFFANCKQLPGFQMMQYHMCLLLVMKLLGREKEPWVKEKEREEQQKVPTSTRFQERNLKHGKKSKTFGSLKVVEELRLVVRKRGASQNRLWGPPPSPPPRNCPKLFTGLLQPTFKEGTGSFVSGGPYGPGGDPPPPSPPPRNCPKLFNTGL